MHRCYPECRPKIGFHVNKTVSGPVEEQKAKFLEEVSKSFNVGDLGPPKDPSSRRIQVGSAPKPLFTPPTPSPDNYQILKMESVTDEYHILLVHYPGCTNYSGNKCLVVKASLLKLVEMKRLDPHFTEVVGPNSVEIVARFPPSDVGMEMAKKFVLAITT